MLRSVKGGSAVDLDSRALTTEDDLVDLDELYPPDDDHSHSDDETAQTERSPGRHVPRATQQPEHGGAAPDNVADRGGAGRRDQRRRRRDRRPQPPCTPHRGAPINPPSSRRTTAPRLLPRGPTRKPARRRPQWPSLARLTGGRFPTRRRALAAAALAVVVAGAAVSAITQLLPGSAAGHHQSNGGSTLAASARRLYTADRRVRRAVGCHPEARDVVDSRTPRCRAAGR